VTNIPAAAIEAAAAAMFHFADVTRPQLDGMEWFLAEARAALEAAMPAIREAIEQEIAAADYTHEDLVESAAMYEYVLSIVRGSP
jgi:hypothetical protein